MKSCNANFCLYFPYACPPPSNYPAHALQCPSQSGDLKVKCPSNRTVTCKGLWVELPNLIRIFKEIQRNLAIRIWDIDQNFKMNSKKYKLNRLPNFGQIHIREQISPMRARITEFGTGCQILFKFTYANRFPLCVPSPFKLPCSRITVPFTVR